MSLAPPLHCFLLAFRFSMFGSLRLRLLLPVSSSPSSHSNADSMLGRRCTARTPASGARYASSDEDAGDTLIGGGKEGGLAVDRRPETASRKRREAEGKENERGMREDGI